MSDKFIKTIILGENKRGAISHCNKDKRNRKQNYFPI